MLERRHREWQGAGRQGVRNEESQGSRGRCLNCPFDVAQDEDLFDYWISLMGVQYCASFSPAYPVSDRIENDRTLR